MKVSSDLVSTPSKIENGTDGSTTSATGFEQPCDFNQPFRKGYLGDWSEEIFEIALRLPTVPVTYNLRDLAGEVIKGKFYESEIQKVLKSDDERFDVDRVLKTRKRNGQIQYFVSWKGYPSKFNCRVDELVSK